MNERDLDVLIKDAFKGIPPGKVGLREAYAYDDRMEGDDLIRARALDIESDWNEIPDIELRRGQSVWPFVDDGGFRFLLPRVMIWSLDLANIEEWIVESLFYNLVAESRAPEASPKSIIQRLSLNNRQIFATGKWIEFYRQFGAFKLSEIEQNHVADWQRIASDCTQ